jgi:Tfp pilus assembly protein PilN
MSKINLIPEVKQKKQKIQKVNATVSSITTFTGVVLIGLIVILLGYNGVLLAQIKSTNDKIAKTEASIKTMKDLEDQVVNLEQGLKDVKLITEKNKSWTKFFSELEKATPDDVQFLSFAINGNQVTAGLKGKEVNSIDRFISSFTNYKDKNDQNLFGEVVVNSYNKKDTGQYLFQAKFNVNEGIAW